MDGRCAGSLVAQYEKNYNAEDFFEVDYMVDLTPMLNKIKPKERVYFVDYSFNENTKWILDKLINIDCDIIWIDHHTSSFELIKSYPELNNIKGIRQDNISGGALVYMYFNDCEFEDTPYYIKLVSDYDCWIFKYNPDTTYFKIGLETENYNALDNIWKELFYYGKLDQIIQKGKIIKQYIDNDNTYYRNQFAYESEIGGYKALVINRKSNSWIFGNQYDKYPLVCVWVFNGEKYSYSIYSSNPNIDCSKIAENYGGGGHKGASGFSSDKLLFVKKEVSN